MNLMKKKPLPSQVWVKSARYVLNACIFFLNIFLGPYVFAFYAIYFITNSCILSNIYFVIYMINVQGCSIEFVSIAFNGWQESIE